MLKIVAEILIQNSTVTFYIDNNKAVADGPVGQVLAGPVSECNKNILIISITMLT